MNAISIKDLVKTYPNTEALKGVSLEIKKGETQKQKQSRRAFPKEDDPVEYQKSFSKGPN